MLNAYNDLLVENFGKGADIASQRLDALDQACLAEAIERDANGPFLLVDVGAGRCGFINLVARKTKNGRLVAVDLEDFSEYAAPGITFLQRNLLDASAHIRTPCSILYSQRTIHYLRHCDALQGLRAFSVIMEPGSTLYLSASGMDSELSHGYADAQRPVDERYGYLSNAMQEKHGIRQPVCLYSQDELAALVTGAGFLVTDLSRSTFGNVKLKAVYRPAPVSSPVTDDSH